MLFLDPDDTDSAPQTSASDILISSNDLARRDARSLVFHLLYAMDSFDYQISLESVADNLGRGFKYDIDMKGSLFKEAQAIIAEREALDALIKPLLDNWRFDRLGVCTRLIVRLALWELLNTDTMPSIIINEAIELAKCFAEMDAYKFVNGILDEWVKRNKEEFPEHKS
jgi:N utilization substance protein B